MFDNTFEDCTILHHCCRAEANADVFVLVWVDGEAFRLHIEGESFTLTLRTRFHAEFDSAWNLVRVDDLKALAHSLGVLGGNQSSEPEQLFLDRVDARGDNGVFVFSWVEGRYDCLLFEDLVEVRGVDTWD